MATASSLVQPAADELGKVGQVVHTLEIAVHLIPVDTDVLMDKNLRKPASGANLRAKARGKTLSSPSRRIAS